MSPIVARPLRSEDLAEVVRMRCSLFTDCPQAEQEREVAAYLQGKPAREPLGAVLLVVEQEGRLVGFVEVSLRSHAEGCHLSTPVAYLEAWWVESSARRGGVGSALVRVAEDWARSQGCSELASDTRVDNPEGKAAHLGSGFEEVERIVCYRKPV